MLSNQSHSDDAHHSGRPWLAFPLRESAGGEGRAFNHPRLARAIQCADHAGPSPQPSAWKREGAKAGCVLSRVFCLVLLVVFTAACAGPTEPTTTGTTRISAVTVNPDAPNAKDGVAKRSAFPEPGESIEKPLAYKRLSDEEQFAPAIDPADIPAIVPWDQASKYIGYEITVQGRVVNVGHSNDGKVNFLNFAKDWRGKFYMVVFDDLAKTLDKPVSALFEGRLVRVKGKVETHRGNPQMKITSMDQVEFVVE